MAHLFIYGTLRDNEVCEKVLGRTVLPTSLTPAYAKDYAIFKVADVSYPCLLPEKGTCAQGFILSDLTDEDLQILDRFEGENYKRVPIEVHVGDEVMISHYYQPNQKLQTDGAWDLSVWRQEAKADFLALDFNHEGIRVPSHV